MRKRSLMELCALVTVSVLLIGVMLVPRNMVKADTEPNDSFSTAELITPGNYLGTLNDTDTDDYYKIVVTAGQTLLVNATPTPDLQAYLYLYDQDHNEVARDEPNQGLMAKASWTTNSAQASYSWYFIQLWTATGFGNYTLVVSLKSQNDGNSGGDAGDTFDTAAALASTNATYPGLLRDADTYDYYRIVLLAGQTLSANVTPASTLGIYLYLYDPARNEISRSEPNQGIMATISWTVNSLQANYTDYLLVYMPTGYGNYTIKLSTKPQNDANSGGDSGDTFDRATSVSTGIYSGFLKDADTDDYYETTQNITIGQGMYVTATPSPGQSLEVRLYDQARNLRASNSSNPGVAVVVGARAPSTQPFYIYVSLATGYGSYTLKIIQEPTMSIPSHNPNIPYPGQSVKVSVNVTAPQEDVGNVVLSYRINQNVTWIDVMMSKNASTSLYEGVIPAFSYATNITYKVTGYNTLGDSFTQDNAGQYYSYTVVPEFSSLILMLAMLFTGTSALILTKRKMKH